MRFIWTILWTYVFKKKCKEEEEKHNSTRCRKFERKKKSVLVEGESNRKWTGHIDPENPIIRLRNDGRSDGKKKGKSIDLIFHGDWVYARDSVAHDENGTADGLPGK